MDAKSPEELAADPSTPARVLYELAISDPQLRPQIAAHPNAYQGLLDWLGTLGDPAVDAALAARATGDDVEEIQTTDSTETLSAAPAPVRQSVMPNGPRAVPAVQVSPPVAPATSPVEEPESHNGRTLIIILVSLLALAAVAAIVLLFLNLGRSEETPTSGAPVATPAPSATTTPSATPTPSPTETPTPTPSPTAIKYPAPANAVASDWFISPSGNIACRLGDDSATCTIYENDYQAVGLANCGAAPTTISITETGAGLACSTPSVAPDGSQGVLQYNTSAARGNVACTSTDMGMMCWNQVTGDSFALARSGWTSRTSGPISPDDFGW